MTPATVASPTRSLLAAAWAAPRSWPAFSALAVPDYRTYLIGQAVTNTGTWMQNIAQDWLVLELTGSATAVGTTMALQFLPMLFLGMHGGVIADRYPKRRLLMATQAVNGALTALLAVLALTGHVHVMAVYALALAGGLVFVVDNPARQVFVNELVPPEHLRAAVGLNSAVFQTTRLVGPAVASVLITTVGSGWAFAANAVCYLGPLVALARIDPARLRSVAPLQRAPGQLRSALRHVAERPHVAWTIVLVGVVGTFGLNFPVVLTAMARDTFDRGPGLYGLFNVVLAVGSITGALLAGSRPHTRLRVLVVMAGAFGAAQAAAALAPGLTVFIVALVVMGAANLTFQAMANSSVQLWVAPALRGRVMGLYMLTFVGGTPLGAPLVGWITGHWGARAGMAVCGLVPLAAACTVAAVLARSAAAGRGRAAAEQELVSAA